MSRALRMELLREFIHEKTISQHDRTRGHWILAVSNIRHHYARCIAGRACEGLDVPAKWRDNYLCCCAIMKHLCY